MPPIIHSGLRSIKKEEAEWRSVILNGQIVNFTRRFCRSLTRASLDDILADDNDGVLNGNLLG